MTLYIKLNTRIRDGIGPGFPDTVVGTGFSVSLVPKPDHHPVEVPRG